MPLLAILLLLFLTIPLVEIYLLIKVGSHIGAFFTLLLVVGSAILGAWLLRLQGLSTVAKVQQSLRKGEMPAAELLEGLILLFSGALLLTPGFFTDAIGFLCLVPRVRQAIARRILQSSFRAAVNSRRSTDKHTLNGEFWRDD